MSDAPFAFPEGGFAEGGLAGLVGICRRQRVGICRLRRGFLFPEGRMLVAVGRFLLAGVLAEGWRWCYDPGRAAESVAASD